MSRVCSVCGKGRVSGMKVSHSNIHTCRAWKANVQKVRYKNADGTVTSDYVCTRCLRSGKVERV